MMDRYVLISFGGTQHGRVVAAGSEPFIEAVRRFFGDAVMLQERLFRPDE